MNSKHFTAAVFAKHLGLLTMTVILASCGLETNPVKDYKGLEGVPPQGQQENKPQGVQAGDLFYIELPKKGVSFIEGKPASFAVKVHTVLNNIDYALSASGLPPGVSLTAKDKTTYVISGTVPVGTSPAVGKGTDLDVTIAVVNPKGDAKELHLLEGMETSVVQNVKISPTDEIPVVEPRAALSVVEGESVSISIVVKDKGAHNSEVPAIAVVPADEIESGEVEVISALPGLKISKTPKALGDNRFEFKMSLDTKALAIKAGKKDLTARFAVAFKSPSHNDSADETVDVKIVRKVAPAPVAPVPVAPVAGPAPAPTAAPAAPAQNRNLESAAPATNAAPSTNAPATNDTPASNANAKPADAAPAAPVVVKPESSVKKPAKKPAKKSAKPAAKPTPKPASKKEAKS